jgi:glucose/arabinose dehydrogenase
MSIYRIRSNLCQLVFAACAISFAAHSVRAQAHKLPSEDDYYRILPYKIPDGVVLEPGAIEFMPDGRMAVSSRRGEIWMVHNPLAAHPDRDSRFVRYAHGLHEVLGLAYKDGWLFATQRGEITRIKDTDADGTADLFKTVCDAWSISGDYHEYAFGSRFDKNGMMWIVLCLTGSFTSDVPFRGWCVRVAPDGTMIPTCSGIRSPGGIAMNAEGDVFYTDNQGPWNGTCSLKQLVPGSFVGHPESFRWYPLAKNMGPVPPMPQSNSRLIVETRRVPQLVLPSVLFPYGKMGQSASGIDVDLSSGKFGPFARQLFVGDQTHSTVMRVFLEKVGGRYQGVCFPFRQGFGSGNVPTRFAPDGSLITGGTNRGWGSRGTKPFALERLVWTGKVPFEIHEMHARPDGFDLTFTQTIDPRTAGDPKSYNMQTYCYIYRAEYGSPEVDHTRPTITRVDVGRDRRSVRLFVSKLEPGHIHELHAHGIRSAAGFPLLHAEAYYTLNAIPSK